MFLNLNIRTLIYLQLRGFRYFYFRKTFFDTIDDFFQYPAEYPGRNLGEKYPAISAANTKLITTWSGANYSLYWFDDDDWTVTFVEFPERIFSNDDVELVTVKTFDSDR